jgi:hypothetical protein
MLKSVFITVLATLVTACNPVYKTTYDLSPPQDAQSRICITQCQQTRTYCEQVGVTEDRACADRNKSERLSNKSTKDDDKWYLDSIGCRNAERAKETCENQYVGCFATCGGAVKSRTICTANCDKADPARLGNHIGQ